jgi:hypothetical protein
MRNVNNKLRKNSHSIGLNPMESKTTQLNY